MKKCPFCGEQIQDEAIKCRYCHEFLNSKDQAEISQQSNSKTEKTGDTGDNVCPKCAFKKVPGDEECPNCGVVYEKLNIKKSIPGTQNTISESRQKPKPSIQKTFQPPKKESSKPELSKSNKKPILISCPHCKEQMDIDATHCPHCGKKGGFFHEYVYGYGSLGFLVGSIITYIISSNVTEEGFSFSVFFTLCFCNPLFWIITIPLMMLGALIGNIHAKIAKTKMKNR